MTWLTDRQLETLHASEGLGRWYRLARAERVRSAGRDLGPVAYYEAIAGPLRLSGVPVGLAAVRCPGSGLARLTQVGLWSALARSLATGLDGRAPWRTACVVTRIGGPRWRRPCGLGWRHRPTTGRAEAATYFRECL